MSNYRLDYSASHYYHVFNRGYMKQIIFHSHYDYEKYLNIVDECQKEYPMVCVYILCLLPNHFHFLLQQEVDWLYIAEFMRRIQWSYANYYKVKYNNIRWIPIFEWRYKAKSIETNEYLLDCYKYIQNNPLKHQLVDSIDKRPYLFLKRPVSLF